MMSIFCDAVIGMADKVLVFWPIHFIPCDEVIKLLHIQFTFYTVSFAVALQRLWTFVLCLHFFIFSLEGYVFCTWFQQTVFVMIGYLSFIYFRFSLLLEILLSLLLLFILHAVHRSMNYSRPRECEKINLGRCSRPVLFFLS